ncbi:GDP-mannose 4,6-dehydratase [Streptomyces sp. Ru72]|uniref:GDP-mannose 4,6-dehydratase n=1 Tax=Streptomyces sp. Ru72 TaxID=2080747 RepID=UPI0035BE3F03
MSADGARKAVVTGGSGFVGSHLVRRLLERDYQVHATVRSAAHSAKVLPLHRLQQEFPGRLTLFEADLLRPGSATWPTRTSPPRSTPRRRAGTSPPPRR